MKIFTGADHRGFALKQTVDELLTKDGHEVVDMGTYNDQEACDYPQASLAVAKRVAAEPGSRGILLCMTGIGHSIAANKVPGAYAALVYNKEAAALSRQHNNSNILVLGSKFVAPADVAPIIQTWITTDFEGGRHARRFGQIQAIEKEYLK